jgi:hypothetical protein
MKKKIRDRLSKTTQIHSFMKIRRAGAELFHADGQTDMAKLIVALRTFTKAPKTQVNDMYAHKTFITNSNLINSFGLKYLP